MDEVRGLETVTPSMIGAPASPWPLRCMLSGNPCGTDTWMRGTRCECLNCTTWLAVEVIRFDALLRSKLSESSK